MFIYEDDDPWFIKIIMGAVFGLLILMLLGLFGGLVLAINGRTPSQRAYTECIEDGRKPYECYSMIYGGRVQ